MHTVVLSVFLPASRLFAFKATTNIRTRWPSGSFFLPAPDLSGVSDNFHHVLVRNLAIDIVGEVRNPKGPS